MVCLSFSWGKSHFEVVLAPVGTAYALGVFLYLFGWALAESLLEGVGPQNLQEQEVCC